MDAEIWKDIDGYEGLYQVSNCGRVKSFAHKTPRILKARLSGKGYPTVALYYNGKRKDARIHRLVATAFIPNPESKPEVNHIDGDKLNNAATNLEWVTASENTKHAYAIGLKIAPQGENHHDAKLTDAQVVYIRDNPDNLPRYKLVEMFGVAKTTITQIQIGKTYKRTGGRTHKAKLQTPRIPDDIRDEIKRSYVPGSREFGSRALARRFGVKHITILRIVHETN